MLTSLTWLDELLGGVGLAAEELAELLTGLGIEVERMRSCSLPGVIVGEIRGLRRHPDAERLTIVTLFDGARELQVVCGAGNLPAPGGKVAFAPSGVVLPGGVAIGARSIRGVDSTGMICSETELDIGSDAEGILVLPSTWPVGASLASQVPGIDDTVLELSVTPNRPDALGHLGIARDLAVKLGRDFAPPPPPPVPACPPLDDLVGLDDSAAGRCGRYLGFALEGASVGPSPLWLRVRLHRLGLRAIANAVDITNLVQMECGQPIHIFDRDRLEEGRVVVRTAAAGETLLALDGSELRLGEHDLVIADARRPHALAGVMGGKDSGVVEASRRLLLEVAWFSPTTVRATARRVALHTDSSHRFERCVDHGLGLEWAARRALALLHELCAADPTGASEVRGELPVRPRIRFRPARVAAVLGMTIPVEAAARILGGLAVTVDRSDEHDWVCVPPTHRPDLLREVDLIEEVMRVHGLADLPARAHAWTPRAASDAPRDLCDDDRVRDALRAQGLHETVTFAFTAPEALDPLGDEVSDDRRVLVVNPMNRHQAVLRTHLLPRLLDCVAHNLAHHGRDLALFEVGRTYAWPAAPASGEGGAGQVDHELPREDRRASAVLAAGARRRVDPRDLVERMSAALRRLGLPCRTRPAARRAYLHPGVQVGLWCEDTLVGVVGEVHPDLLSRWNLAGAQVVYGELDLAALPRASRGEYRSISSFPATTRDLSLDLPIEVSASLVAEHLDAAAAQVLGRTQSAGLDLAATRPDDPRVAIIEDYRGAGVEPGRRALLLRLEYRASDRTVTDAEVQPVHDAIVARACETLGEIGVGAHPR